MFLQLGKLGVDIHFHLHAAQRIFLNLGGVQEFIDNRDCGVVGLEGAPGIAAKDIAENSGPER